MLGSQANLLESLINLSVSVIILLFSAKSKLSSLYNKVLRVKGAMFDYIMSINLRLILHEYLTIGNISFSMLIVPFIVEEGPNVLLTCPIINFLYLDDINLKTYMTIPPPMGVERPGYKRNHPVFVF